MKYLLLLAVVLALCCATPPGDFPTNVADHENTSEVDEYTVVGFDKLASFKYQVPDDPLHEPAARALLKQNRIPQPIKNLNGQRVAVDGFMLPLRVENGKITEFLILRDQSMCCYGAVPKINEWISVRMPPGQGVKPLMDVKVKFYGTLKVGPVVENGYLVGIYEMDGEPRGGLRK